MICALSALEIYNSRGEPTIKIFLKTNCGIFTGTAPSGRSRGRFEAKIKDVKHIIESFPKLKKKFLNKEESEVDKIIHKIGINKIGANLSTALSIASWKATSKVYSNIFPFPLGNVIGGGAHGGNTAIQEFLVLPKSAKNIRQAIETNFTIWQEVGNALKSRGLCGRNDEGAWISKLDDIKSLDLLCNIAEQHDAVVGLDFAASHFYRRGSYNYPNKKFGTEEQLNFIERLVKSYKIYYIEDPFHEADFKSFAKLKKRVKNIIICGDDLYATQPPRLEKGIKMKAGNAVIIKPDQAGTITKAANAIKIAKKGRFIPIISHRSGESCDSIIADIAVKFGVPIIKCGISSGERVAKLNRLLELWSLAKTPSMAKIKI